MVVVLDYKYKYKLVSWISELTFHGDNIAFYCNEFIICKKIRSEIYYYDMVKCGANF